MTPHLHVECKALMAGVARHTGTLPHFFSVSSTAWVSSSASTVSARRFSAENLRDKHRCLSLCSPSASHCRGYGRSLTSDTRHGSRLDSVRGSRCKRPSPVSWADHRAALQTHRMPRQGCTNLRVRCSCQEPPLELLYKRYLDTHTRSPVQDTAASMLCRAGAKSRYAVRVLEPKKGCNSSAEDSKYDQGASTPPGRLNLACSRPMRKPSPMRPDEAYSNELKHET